MSWSRWLSGVEQELGNIEDPRERNELWARAKREVDDNFQGLLVSLSTQLVASIVIFGGAWFAALRLRPNLGHIGGFSTAVALGVFAVLGASLLSTQFRRRAYRREVRRLLHARGIPVCLNCGYNLRGQTEPRCPECGRKFDLAEISTAATSPPQSNPCRSVPRRSEPRP